MSKFMVGVGGTGAKLIQTLTHLSAAGMLADDSGGGLNVLMVDPDAKNGTGAVTTAVAASYAACHALECGTTPLFQSSVKVAGPWSPVTDNDVSTLSTFFHYALEREHNPPEADMMELLFTPEERNLKILEGFRGLPALGSAILSKTIDFTSEGPWSNLRHEIRGAASSSASVPLLLAGSVFGGSGAAGVPTICRLLESELTKTTKNVRLGLVLFLPYFSYKPVDGQSMQADPHAFAAATVEALKYYHEGRFLQLAKSIYTVGEETLSVEPRSAVGGKEQVNDPHFLELIAGIGALRFFAKEDKDGTASVAARAQPNEVQWQDLPFSPEKAPLQIKRLRTMILFAVAFHFYFMPQLRAEWSKGKKGLLSNHRRGEESTQLAELGQVDEYTVHFLTWLMHLSAPRGLPNFTSGLVDLSIFAIGGGGQWRLRQAEAPGTKGEFDQRRLPQLFVNADGLKVPDVRTIHNLAESPVKDYKATGTGIVLRAIYDACAIA